MNPLVFSNFQLLRKDLNKIQNNTNNSTESLKKEILFLKKKVCRLENKNISVTNNIKSTKDNTILFLSISELTNSKIIIINQLIQCNYNFVIGYDIKYHSNETILTNNLIKFSNNIISSELIKSIIKIPLINNKLIIKYGKKIKNFNGKWLDNPSKLGSLEWFHTSNYEYIWYVEDDVFCKNWNSFLEKYETNSNDLLCRIDSQHVPEWYYRQWRIGNYSHGFELSHLYIARYSKQFINYLFEFIKNTESTSHHELFIPYVLNYYHLSHSNIEDTHVSNLHLNDHTKTSIYNVSSNHVNKYKSIIFHPFK